MDNGNSTKLKPNRLELWQYFGIILTTKGRNRNEINLNIKSMSKGWGEFFVPEVLDVNLNCRPI